MIYACMPCRTTDCSPQCGSMAGHRVRAQLPARLDGYFRGPLRKGLVLQPSAARGAKARSREPAPDRREPSADRLLDGVLLLGFHDASDVVLPTKRSVGSPCSGQRMGTGALGLDTPLSSNASIATQ